MRQPPWTNGRSCLTAVTPAQALAANIVLGKDPEANENPASAPATSLPPPLSRAGRPQESHAATRDRSVHSSRPIRDAASRRRDPPSRRVGTGSRQFQN